MNPDTQSMDLETGGQEGWICTFGPHSQEARKDVYVYDTTDLTKVRSIIRPLNTALIRSGKNVKNKAATGGRTSNSGILYAHISHANREWRADFAQETQFMLCTFSLGTAADS